MLPGYQHNHIMKLASGQTHQWGEKGCSSTPQPLQGPNRQSRHPLRSCQVYEETTWSRNHQILPADSVSPHQRV